MKTLNELSQAKYGKDYAQLPDDGAEQDHIMHEYARQYPSDQERREAIEWLNHDVAYCQAHSAILATIKHSQKMAAAIQSGFISDEAWSE